MDTIIRYAGRKLTGQLLAMAQRELATNKHLEAQEKKDLRELRDICKTWLRD